MHRFFLRSSCEPGKLVNLEPEDDRHAATTLRLRAGNQVLLVDSLGQSYAAVITGTGNCGVRLQVQDRVAWPDAEASLSLTLVQGLPKGDKMEFIIQKCTELGMRKLIPLVAARSIARPEGTVLAGRLTRWHRVAREAARQSGRTAIPEIAPLARLAEALPADVSGDRELRLLLWEGYGADPLKEVLLKARAALSRPTAVTLLVGPEGGWEEAEVEKCKELGCLPVSLGPRILRTETAGPVATAIVFYEFGDLGGTSWPGLSGQDKSQV